MQVTCAGCGESFEAKRKTAKYCSGTCRTRGNRRADEAPVATSASAGLSESTRAELARLRKLDTVQGQQVMVIALRMESLFETGSAVAALSREHSRLMGLLSRDAKVVDPVQAAKDEVARKRAQRNAG